MRKKLSASVSQGASVVARFPVMLGTSARCESCVQRVCEAARGISGVFAVECEPGSVTLVVAYDPAQISESELAQALAGFGFDTRERFEHVSYRVTGLD